MNIQAHYDSYRANVLADALPGYQEYCASRPTKTPEKYPTIQSFLIYTTNNIKNAVQAGDQTLYQKSIQNHQTTLLKVFERMVEEYWVQFGERTHEEKQAVLLDMIQRLGWKWFRFCPIGWQIELDKMVWIPRYNVFMKYAKPAFDANEMALILQVKPSRQKADEILKAKLDAKLKVVSPSLDLVPVDTLNKNTVLDWTQELFI